ncbi:MAG: DNRLRE domain-containing protein [Bacteroidetes bacterium]|nr:DNRLRE domain-containing protein [Bacteroidota bacterium]
MKQAYVFFALFASAGLFSQNDTLCQQPDASTAQDASLGYHDFFNTSANNYGSDIYLKAFCLPGASGGQNTNRGLLFFDLSTIPANAQVLSAGLSLYATGFINTLLPGHLGNNLAYIEQVTSPWNEFSVTWNNQPATTTTNRGTLLPSTSSTQDYTVNLTVMVQGMVNNPATNMGFMLRLDTENPNTPAALAFYSSDNTIPSKFPALCVIWKGSELSSGETHETVVYATSPEPQYVLAYPNPAVKGGEIVLEHELLKGDVSLTITDAHGRIVRQEKTAQANGKIILPVNNLACGFYFVQLVADNRHLRSKFVV